MFKEAVEGLQELITDDIPSGGVILVLGDIGTLKSAFVHNLLSTYVERTGTHGLYATLEESAVSHLRNTLSLGIRTAESFHIFDYEDMRHEWMKEDIDMMTITYEVINHYKNKYYENNSEICCFALDSLNGLYALASIKNIRKDVYNLFSTLKMDGLTSFVIVERTPPFDETTKIYELLADGVIELGTVERADEVKRYIQIKKLRGTEHDMRKHQLGLGKYGLKIFGPLYASIDS